MNNLMGLRIYICTPNMQVDCVSQNWDAVIYCGSIALSAVFLCSLLMLLVLATRKR